MKAVIDRHRSKILYLIVGGWNTVFGFGAFALLYHLCSDWIHTTVILTFSYILSITNAYICYKIFVFKTKGGVIREYFRFYVVYGGAFMINLVLLPVLMNVLILSAYMSQALITIMTIVGSYIMHKRFTFNRLRNESQR